METSPFTGEGLQILTYAQRLWPLSSEGSLTYNTYCDTGHPFIMVISDRENPWHSHLYCRAFRSGALTTCFYDLGLSQMGFKHPTFRSQGQGSNPLRQRRIIKEYIYGVCALKVSRLSKNEEKQWRNLCLNAFLKQLQSGQEEFFNTVIEHIIARIFIVSWKLIYYR